MQIDWFTLVAQIVNFLILLYLLKRFLYRPIIDAMEQREQMIAARLQEAEHQRKEAEEEAQRYLHQRLQLEHEHEELLAAITKQVEERRGELLVKVDLEIQEKRRNWQASLREEQEDFLRRLRQQLGSEAVELARRTLKNMANIHIETQMAEMFMRRMEELDSEKKAEIADSIQNSDRAVVIRSAFELPQDIRGRIVDTMREKILDGHEMTARFEIAPGLIAGIEMQVDGHQVAWVIRDYLAGLERQIVQVIEQEIA